MFEPSVSVPDHLSDAPGRWFLFDEQRALLFVDSAIPVGIEPPIPVRDMLVLGTDADGPVLTGLINSEDVAGLAEGATLDLRHAFVVMDEDDWHMAGRASQVLTWDADHGCCSRCGAETERHHVDRARSCGQCGFQAYPRLTPAVIALVEREDGRALLAWGRQFPGRFFSALAGFVEPGESLEGAVAREIKEEAGIEVANIRYFGSQPWPFPHSIMIGFNADYAGGEIRIQESEIVEADWFAPDQLPPVPAGRMSIAAWLIEDWIRRRGEGI